MNTPTAIFGGLALIALALYAASPRGSAVAQPGGQTGDAEWAMVGHNEALIMWKLNRKSGELLACSYKSKECDRVRSN